MADSKIDWNQLALPKVKTGSKPKTKERAGRARKAKTTELSSKQQVRLLDRYCRFPKCGCRRTGHATAVAHLKHKGMGGNPKGDRSKLYGLILLCAPRHREHPVSLDRGTLKITPTSMAGTRGACFWYVHYPSLQLPPQMIAAWRGGPNMTIEWFLLAHETAPHQFAPFTGEQLAVLAHLAAMTR
jgi:hypothetical protein